MDAHKVTKDFEHELALYTGAPYAVVVNSCTNALLLACAYNFRLSIDEKLHQWGHYGTGSINTEPGWKPEVTIPKHTYVSVPQSIIHAGGTVKFRDEDWQGMYQLKPYPIWDSAKWITSGMYKKGQYICLSLHWAKTLAVGQGGVILHDNPDADKWFRKARFDGRTEGVLPKDDTEIILGHHCYMSPRDSAEGLSRLSFLPKHNPPQPRDDYPDLSQLNIFKKEYEKT